MVPGSGAGPGADVLAVWAKESHRRTAEPAGRLRFALYGRVSTEDWQDPVTSRVRQCEQAAALVAGHGAILTEFFDVGRAGRWRGRGARRRRPWWQRWLIRTGAGKRS
jgi:site-specific DNA recombinase